MTRVQRGSPPWRDEVRKQFGVGSHDATLDGLTALLEVILDQHSDLGRHLTEFGRRCGAAGHSLDDTAAWISLFADGSSPPVRTRLLERPAAIQLAGGWMTGHNDLVAAPMVDPFDVTALKVRLHQEYARLDAFGLDVSQTLALVVLEPAFAHEPVPSATIAAVARHEFSFGDTVAECPNGRVIVLTEQADTLANLARRTAATAAQTAGAPRDAVRTWIEVLGADRSMLAEFLDELTG